MPEVCVRLINICIYFQLTPLKKVMTTFLKLRLKTMKGKQKKEAKKLVQKFKEISKLKEFNCIAYLIQTRETLRGLSESC